MAEERNTSGRFASVRRWGGRVLTWIGGMVVFSLVLLLIVGLFLRRETVPRQTILELNLEEELVEYVPEDPVAEALHGRRTTIRDIVEALHRAAEDDRVVALVARVGSGGFGMGQVEEIRDAVAVFRASGKPAVLFSETFGEVQSGTGGYYLATAFDSIFLQPSGDVNVAGLSAETPFLRGTLDRLDVEPRMDHRHEYKSAKYLFTETEYTEPDREATTRVLESIYGNLIAAIASGRQMTEEEVRTTLRRGPFYGQEAVTAGLVDRLAYRDEVFDSLQARHGQRAEFLFVSEYLRRAGRFHRRGDRIALIYGVGGVQRGKSEFNPVFGGLAMGSETVTRAFREAIEDDRVRAILFRIDTPGGSAVASDAIWRETVRARAKGKPVIVSMGNVAASGGYWVSMSADRIVAQPSTLTGSIGVVGGKLVTSDFWNQLGVNWDHVEVGDNTAMWSSIRDYTPEEWARLQTWLDRIYLDFTTKVAEGRGMTPEQVHEIARGRVWTGADAQRLGLVDELGGFPVALRLAREAVDLAPDADIDLRVYPERRTLLQMIIERGPESSWPTGANALTVRLLESMQPLFQLARQAGLLQPPGVLTMPPLEVR